ALATGATPMPHDVFSLFPKAPRLVIMCAVRTATVAGLTPMRTQSMSRRFLSLGATLCLLAVATPAIAQTSSVERQVRFGVKTGASMPMGDFGDAVNIGWHFDGFGEFRPENFPVTLRGELGYHKFGSDRITDGTLTAEQEASIIPVVASAIF